MYFASQTGAFSPHRGKCGASLPVLRLELTFRVDSFFFNVIKKKEVNIFHMRWDFSRSVCQGDWKAARGHLVVTLLRSCLS